MSTIEIKLNAALTGCSWLRLVYSAHSICWTGKPYLLFTDAS